jgi:hypothetical protein
MEWLGHSLDLATVMQRESLWTLVFGFSISAAVQVYVNMRPIAPCFGGSRLREAPPAMRLDIAGSLFLYATLKTVFKNDPAKKQTGHHAHHGRSAAH